MSIRVALNGFILQHNYENEGINHAVTPYVNEEHIFLSKDDLMLKLGELIN